jgi:hypothetical protein
LVETNELLVTDRTHRSNNVKGSLDPDQPDLRYSDGLKSSQKKKPRSQVLEEQQKTPEKSHPISAYQNW